MKERCPRCTFRLGLIDAFTMCPDCNASGYISIKKPKQTTDKKPKRSTKKK